MIIVVLLCTVAGQLNPTLLCYRLVLFSYSFYVLSIEINHGSAWLAYSLVVANSPRKDQYGNLKNDFYTFGVIEMDIIEYNSCDEVQQWCWSQPIDVRFFFIRDNVS